MCAQLSIYSTSRRKFWLIETLSYLGPKSLSLVAFDIRDYTTKQFFRQKIKKWKPDRCPCRLCKKYITNLGLLIKNSAT